jgi:hypothetical protein
MVPILFSHRLLVDTVNPPNINTAKPHNYAFGILYLKLGSLAIQEHMDLWGKINGTAYKELLELCSIRFYHSILKTTSCNTILHREEGECKDVKVS